MTIKSTERALAEQDMAYLNVENFLYMSTVAHILRNNTSTFRKYRNWNRRMETFRKGLALYLCTALLIPLPWNYEHIIIEEHDKFEKYEEIINSLF